MAEDKQSLFAHLNGETGKIGWHDLQPWFAKGDTLCVAPGVDLVAVAAALAADDSVAVKRWLDAGQLGPVPVDQASAWFATKAEVWAVVVLPWILVQQA
ncbi:MAG: DUF2288 domain-containing protein [Gammaproteobacteria bacterium HGW-Gammaproteobacteria-14]|nr:MAG: DUF2288 domain-containing protein [Gammaproteobacteria bacterium HGW-Gammaproteobacteria-14]